MKIHSVMDVIIDFFRSIFNPISTQNEIRLLKNELRQLKDKRKMLTSRVSIRDRQIATLQDDRDRQRMLYHEARDQLAEALFERLKIDDNVTDIKFGKQTENFQHKDEPNEYIICHAYFGYDKTLVTGKGEGHVDALIDLYQSAKDRNIEGYENAEIPTITETDEAE